MTTPLSPEELAWLRKRFGRVPPESGHPQDGTLEGVIARLLASLDARPSLDVEALARALVAIPPIPDRFLLTKEWTESNWLPNAREYATAIAAAYQPTGDREEPHSPYECMVEHRRQSASGAHLHDDQCWFCAQRTGEAATPKDTPDPFDTGDGYGLTANPMAQSDTPDPLREAARAVVDTYEDRCIKVLDHHGENAIDALRAALTEPKP